MNDPIISLTDWFQTAPGSYLLAWEQAQFDLAVADLFGFNAMQLGLPELHTLQTNRMPHRWLALPEELRPHRPPGAPAPDGMVCTEGRTVVDMTRSRAAPSAVPDIELPLEPQAPTSALPAALDPPAGPEGTSQPLHESAGHEADRTGAVPEIDAEVALDRAQGRAQDRAQVTSATSASSAAWANGEAAPAGAEAAASPPAPAPTALPAALARPRVALVTDAAALPFPAASLDLVVLPHTLELSADPHHVLREVERVLVPEGRVVISGFNPTSLWGWRQGRARMAGRIGLNALGASNLYLPEAGDFIGPWRLRDWLRLLSFELESERFGCYRPAVQTEKWLARTAWMDPAGSRWWPIFGAVYFLVAVKRVRGVRLLGPAWKPRRASGARAPVSVASRH